MVAQDSIERMSERPPLSALVYETLDGSLHKLDATHWQIIAARRIKKFYPLDAPVPSAAPQSLLRDIRGYASILFTSEADIYERVRQNTQYHQWLLGLANRVKARVLTALDRLEDADPDSMLLGVNGLLKRDVERSLEEMLWEMVRDYSQARAPSQVSRNRIDGQPQPASEPHAELPKTARTTRMSASIISPSAARKMEAYMNSKAMNQKEFSIQAGTTEKTIRKFRQTGRVKRSILDGIASAMGLSRENLLG